MYFAGNQPTFETRLVAGMIVMTATYSYLTDAHVPVMAQDQAGSVCGWCVYRALKPLGLQCL